jgi:uncharacterized cofD-like protein
VNCPIVVIGGGTGAARLLAALRTHSDPAQNSLIVPVTDTGRSTGVARTMFIMGGPGDARQAIASLAGSSAPWAEVMETRLKLPGRELDGMTLGNVVLAGRKQRLGSLAAAIDEFRQNMGVVERVVPASDDDMVLHARLTDGTEVAGELSIRTPGKADIEMIWTENGHACEQALTLVREAGVIVLGPGSLWTSVAAVLAVPGVAEAIRANDHALTIFVCNTTTQPGQTDGLSVSAHMRVVRKGLGAWPRVGIINRGRLDLGRVEELAAQGLEVLNPTDEEMKELRDNGIQVMTEDLLDRSGQQPDLWNKLPTTYHDMATLASIIAGAVGER